MATPGLVLMAGSGRPTRVFHALVARGLAGVSGRKPRVAVSLAALPHDPSVIDKVAGWLVGRSFGDAEVTRFTVAGERDPMPADEARAIVEQADLVFLSGGDPVLGARILVDSGADAWLRDARARGTALGGGSAGAIMLGAWWATWPDEPNGPFDGGTLVPCTCVVPDLVVDTHAEEDAWAELALVRGMLDAAGHHPRLRGIPTDGGLIVHPDGGLETVGDGPFIPPSVDAYGA
jgi:cyanophycinase-like exopeptidase